MAKKKKTANGKRKGPFAGSSKFGTGGEIHQTVDGEAPVLTTQQGVPIADDQNSLKVGSRGPVTLEDFHLREKIFHFDHERIPERVVHARGFGAHGFFELYESLADISRADVFQRPGEKTPVFVRFSTVAGSKGSPDLARDVRGFAVKFYTQEGNWDLVGNNIPVFFIQDAIKFPDLIHAAKPEPDRGFPQAQTAHDNFWDFISLTPESMHMVMWIMSDRTIPRSFRFMEGFGVHTFRLINADGKSTFVKFHWKPKLGLQSVAWNEAVKINGGDPDFHRRDLWTAIEAGDFPEWELGLQLFDDDFADKFAFDVLDATKLIPEEDVPIRIVGRMVLDRRVDNFFAETEQVAFCTQNIVPGIDFTNDPLLQGRNFSYLDTQIKRLGGPNFAHLPINAPKCPFAHFQQDGHMAMHNPVGRTNYEPNSRGAQGGPRESPELGFMPFAAEENGPHTQQPPLIQDQLDWAAAWLRRACRELDERRRIHCDIRRHRPIKQTALPQHAPPTKKTGFADMMAPTKLANSDLRLLPATNEFEPTALFGGIGTFGHEAPPLASTLPTATRCLCRTDTFMSGCTCRAALQGTAPCALR